MNKSERAAKRVLEREGWEVHRPGWPDFLCVRGDEIKLVEVKYKKDRLSDTQKQCIKILRSHKLPVVVVRPTGESVDMATEPDSNKVRLISCSHEMHYTKSGKVYYVAYSPKYIFKPRFAPTKRA